MTDPKRKSILIVESPGEDRKVIGDFLHALGYTVLYADKGNEGLRTFNQEGPDLVLVEILLSGMNGLSVCKMIKDQADWAKVVILSKLYQSHQMRKDSKVKYKADGYLEKPFELVELRDLVRTLIGEAGAGPQDLPEDSSLRSDMLRYRRGSGRMADPDPSLPPSRPRREPEPELQLETEPPPVPKRPPFPDLDALDSRPPEDDTRPDTTPGAGVFDSETLARMLRELAETGFSGTLKLVAGELAKIAYFADGTPVYVKSNLRSESLGGMLLADGTISEEIYAQAMSLMKKTGKKLGTVLVGMNALTPEDLGERIARQTGRKLAGVLTWEGGTYELEQRPAQQLGAPHFPFSVAAVLACAFDRQADQQDFGLQFAADAGRVPVLVLGRVGKDAAAVASDVDRAVTAAVNGTRTAREVVGACGAESTSAIRSLYRLMTIGAVRLDEPLDSEPGGGAATIPSPPDPIFDDLGYVPEIEPVSDFAPPPAFDDELPASDPAMTGDLGLELETEPGPFAEADSGAGGEVPSELQARAARIGDEDDYEVLGIAEDDPARTIKEAYRSLAERFDPDSLPPEATDADRNAAARVRERVALAYENVKAERRARRRAREERNEDATLADAAPLAGDDQRRNAAESELAYREGIAHLAERNFHEAITQLEAAAGLNPEEADYQAMLGWAIYRMLREAPRTADEAMALVKGALALNAQGDVAHLIMARMYAGEEDVGSAIKFYKKTLSINPDNGEAKTELRDLERDTHLRSSENGAGKPWYKKKLW